MFLRFGRFGRFEAIERFEIFFGDLCEFRDYGYYGD